MSANSSVMCCTDDMKLLRNIFYVILPTITGVLWVIFGALDIEHNGSNYNPAIIPIGLGLLLVVMFNSVLKGKVLRIEKYFEQYKLIGGLLKIFYFLTILSTTLMMLTMVWLIIFVRSRPDLF